MNKMIVNNYKDLSEYMINVANDGNIICSVLFYDGVSKLMKYLIQCADVSIGCINFSEEDYFGYDREYYVTLDTDFVLDISPAWHRENGYIYNETDVIIFDGDTRSSIVPIYNEKECYELQIIDEDYNEEMLNSDSEACCGDCCGDCCTCDSDEDNFTYLFSKLF